jgi:hypothetical protein
MPAGDGDDYRGLPLSLRKTNLARCRGHGAKESSPLRFKQGYREAVEAKVKNPSHSDYRRVQDQFGQARFSQRCTLECRCGPSPTAHVPLHKSTLAL